MLVGRISVISPLNNPIRIVILIVGFSYHLMVRWRKIANNEKLSSLLTRDKNRFLEFVTLCGLAGERKTSDILLQSKYGVLLLKNIIHFEDDLTRLYQLELSPSRGLLMKLFLTTPELYLRIISSTEGFISLAKQLPDYREHLFALLASDKRLQGLVNQEKINKFREDGCCEAQRGFRLSWSYVVGNLITRVKKIYLLRW